MQKLYKKLILLVAIIIPLVAIVGTTAAASTQSFIEAKANVLSSDQIRQLNSKLNSSLLYNLAAYSLLSHSYRSESWLDSQSYGLDSSSFSDFGRGGFSSGGGASGGW